MLYILFISNTVIIVFPFSNIVMEFTEDQPQLDKDDSPAMIQLQTIVIMSTTVVHSEHSTNGSTSSGETVISSDNNFASNYNLFTETTDANKKCYISLSCKKFIHVLAIVLISCLISGLFLDPIISYVMRDSNDFKNDENFNDTPLVCCIVCKLCKFCII